MARFITRECPKCRGFFRLAISRLAKQPREHSITALCHVCGYKLDGWRMIVRQTQPPDVRSGRTRKVFK
jgi:hypothetical protein